MTRIQLRHDTATNWTTVNPILAEGEAGIETDTNKFKIGDGATTWNNLNYQGGGGDLSNYYTKSETDTALNNKQDKFSATVPLVMQEPSEPASPATTTEDDGVTFTVDSGRGYNTIILSEGGEYGSTLQLQTTENSNGIIDRTKNIVYDFEITETTDLEFRWASNDYGNTQVYIPKILLGKNDSNNVFTPRYAIGYNFSTTTPYENFLYIGDVQNYLTENSDPPGWIGTKYNCSTNSLGNIPLNYGNVNLVKARLRVDNDTFNLYLDITVSSEDEGPYTQSFDLGGYMNDDINCAVFMTNMGVTYQGDNFGVFDPTTGIQKWNPAKTLSRSLRLNIDNSLIVDNSALGVNSNNYYNKSEVDTEISNKADIDGSNMDASVKNFDGEWVFVNATVSQATAIGSYTIDLSSYLPNDNYAYECMFAWNITTVANGLTGTAIGATNAYSYNGVINGGFTNHILTGKTVAFSIWNSALQSCNVKLIRYRRLGTNQ